jgi:hypothetical protein
MADEEKDGTSGEPAGEDLTAEKENRDLEEGSVRTPSIIPMTAEDFLGYCKIEVPNATKFGFAQLALLYSLINNAVGITQTP